MCQRILLLQVVKGMKCPSRGSPCPVHCLKNALSRLSQGLLRLHYGNMHVDGTKWDLLSTHFSNLFVHRVFHPSSIPLHKTSCDVISL